MLSPRHAAADGGRTTANPGDFWEHRSKAPAALCRFLMLQGVKEADRLSQSATRLGAESLKLQKAHPKVAKQVYFAAATAAAAASAGFKQNSVIQTGRVP